MASNAISLRPAAVQTVAATAASTTVTNAFGSQTYCIRIAADTPVNFKVVEAAGATAATTDTYLPANWVDYITVTPGQKISVIRASTDGLITATSGTLFVTEMV